MTPEYVVLHTLRCIGAAGEDRVAQASGIPVGEVVGHLRGLADLGLVSGSAGPFSAWMLSEEGRVRDAETVATELEQTGARAEVQAGYRAFLELNEPLLQVCSDWQMRNVGGRPVLNDHGDEAYDARVLSRLWDIDDSAQELCRRLADTVSRFAPYGARLAQARERALSGDTGAVADDLDSYHNAWFQLHEDLLATLAISREEEMRP